MRILIFVIAMAAFALGNAAAEDRTRLVEITIVAAANGEPPNGTLRLASVSDNGDIRKLTVEGGRTSVHLPVGTQWVVSSQLSEWWFASDYLIVPDGDGTLQVSYKAWPAGRIRGVIKLTDKRSKPPKEISVSATAPPGFVRSLPPFTVSCPISQDGSWECLIPAGTHDIVFRAASFIPAYRWQLHIPTQAATNAGSVELKPGASVAGWVRRSGEVQQTKAPLSGQVEIVRIVPAGADARTRERLSRPVATARTSSQGFFQLVGLATGSYRVVARDAGTAAGEISPVDVFAGAETMIKMPIELRAPITVRVQVTPPEDAHGKRWRVIVYRIASSGSGGEGDSLIDTHVDAEGGIAIPSQAPGTFEAWVHDSSGNLVANSRFETRESDDSPHTIVLRFVNVRGTLKRAGERSAAKLTFGGSHGGVQVATSSNDQGEFTVSLPHAGDWIVDVDEPSISLHTTLHTNITPDANDDASVDLNLTRNRVTGIVVNDDNEPVADASVTAVSHGTAIWSASSVDGTFEFVSLPAGQITLAAQRGKGGEIERTSSVTINLDEDSSTGPVRLSLQTTRRIRAQVMSPRGPVAGAVVTVVSTEPGTPLYTTVTSDVDGSLMFNVPNGVARATAIVLPPGFPLRTFRLPLDGRDVIMHVSGFGGMLRVKVPDSHPASGAFVIEQEGNTIPLPELRRWALGLGSPFMVKGMVEIPNVAAGMYRVCLIDRATGKEACRDAAVSAGSAVDLVIDSWP